MYDLDVLLLDTNCVCVDTSKRCTTHVYGTYMLHNSRVDCIIPDIQVHPGSDGVQRCRGCSGCNAFSHRWMDVGAYCGKACRGEQQECVSTTTVVLGLVIVACMGRSVVVSISSAMSISALPQDIMQHRL